MFKGSNVALITPFKNGELDLDTLKKLVEWHVGEGTHGLVPVGTTGESPTLTHDEHDKVVEEVVRAAAGGRGNHVRDTNLIRLLLFLLLFLSFSGARRGDREDDVRALRGVWRFYAAAAEHRGGRLGVHRRGL